MVRRVLAGYYQGSAAGARASLFKQSQWLMMTLGLLSMLLAAMAASQAGAQDLTASWKKVRQACKPDDLTCGIKAKLVVSNIDVGAAAAASTLSIYLSDNNTFGGGDTLLTPPIGIGALGPDGKRSVKTSFQLDLGVSASGAFLIAVTDSGNAVPESNEANNVAVFANPGPTGIIMFDKLFGPGNVTIPVGARVRWMHKDGGQDHTVTSGTCTNNGCSEDGLFTSVTNNQEFMGQHDEFVQFFNESGVFPYFCLKHEEDMTGVINVVGP